MREPQTKRKQAAKTTRRRSPTRSDSALRLADPPQFEGETPDGKVVGSLVAIVDHVIEGLALNVDDHTKAAVVDLFAGEQLLGSATAFMFRPELSAAGIGTGNHHFQFELPANVLETGVHIISARPHAIVPPRTPPSDAAPIRTAQPPTPSAVGMLEHISEAGWVRGWAWYPSEPARRVEVEILADGMLVGEVVAATHRADLLAAGMGDGDCSFSFGLPIEVLQRPRATMIALRDKRTGLAIAEPRLYERREIHDALGKLADLENDTRLLQSTVTLAADRVAADNRATADLFKIAGDFFLELASVTAAGTAPGSLRTLKAAIKHVTGRYSPMAFGRSDHPHISVCVEATGSLDEIHRTLSALSALDTSIGVEVMLLHTGDCDEAALLPLIADNLRYLHGEDQATVTVQRNRAVQLARGQIVVFLAGYAHLSADALGAIASRFASDETLEVLAAKVVRSDGVIENAGRLLDRGRPIAVGAGQDAAAAALSQPRRIDAVEGTAFAVRRDAWERNRGLNPSLSADAALIDYCTRAAGTLRYEPRFTVVLNR